MCTWGLTDTALEGVALGGTDGKLIGGRADDVSMSAVDSSLHGRGDGRGATWPVVSMRTGLPLGVATGEC